MLRTPAVTVLSLTLVLPLAGCGGDEVTDPTPPTTLPPTTLPPPSVATSIGFVAADPPRGGVIHTGIPAQHNGGVTTGLTMTFNAVSDVDRTVRFLLTLSGPAVGVCLTNNAPSGRPAAPTIEMRAGIPVQIEVRELLLTSVCKYPGLVELATVSLAPVAQGQDAFYTARLATPYTIRE